MEISEWMTTFGCAITTIQGHCYLESENAYTSTMMQHTEALQATLYQECSLASKKPTSLCHPVKMTTTTIHAQKKEKLTQFTVKQGSLDAPEEVLLDQNELAEGHEYFSLGVFEVSP